MPDATIIQLIADYGVGDPAFAEVIQKLTYLDKTIRVSAISVPPFSTIATGLWISQFATVNAFPGLVVYSNTAPRINIAEDKERTYKGKFGHLAYTKLDNGVVVVAVHVGYCFSFIKDNIKSLHLVNVKNEGSQFRSRDYYPDAVMGIAHDEAKFIGEEIPIDSIPDAPTDKIAFIDGYGNLKTTMRKSQNTIPVGTRVRVSCNNAMFEGVVSDETYRVEDGEISFAPGSTGGEDRFMEIWVRGKSAWEAFSRPHVEDTFSIEIVK